MKSGSSIPGSLHRGLRARALTPLHFTILALACFMGFAALGLAQSATTATLSQQNAGENLINLSGAWDPPVKEIKNAKVKYGKSPAAKAGGTSLLIDVSPDSPEAWYSLDQKIGPVIPGDIYRFTCWIKTEGTHGGAGGYLSINAFEAKNPEKRLTYSDSNRVFGTRDWTPVECLLLVPEGAKELRAFVLLNGTGRAWFSNASFHLVSRSPLAPPAKVKATITRQVMGPDFIGFGFEDDPFFYTSSNYDNGVNEADIALRERRIRELKPAIVRSFLYWTAFNPRQDLETFDYDTDFMRGVYRTLDLYQQMNVPVNICGAYWNWQGRLFPFNEANLEKGVNAYVQVLKYLVQEKRYTCIKYVTITNEPDISWEEQGGTFASFVKAHRLLKERLVREGLGSLILVGGDIAEDYNWMKDSILQTDPYVGIYSLHKYLNITQYPLIGYHLGKVKDLIAKHAKPQGAKSGKPAAAKPAFLWEFGYLGDFYAANINDEMQTYRYGLLCAATYMAVMNHGFAGASIWCLQSLHYLNHDEDKMQFGLWEYKEKGWRTRPVYYASSMFSSLYRAGMKPVKVTQEPGSHQFTTAAFAAPDGQLTVYLLNLGNRPVQASLGDLPAREYNVYQYSEDCIPTEKNPLYEKVDALKRAQKWNSATGEIEVAPQTLLVLN